MRRPTPSGKSHVRRKRTYAALLRRNRSPQARVPGYEWLSLLRRAPGTVRRKLARILTGSSGGRILDVGSRKSHYTTGLRGDVWVADLPRRSDVQHQLNLGTNASIAAEIKRRRTNIRGVIFDDMTHSGFASEIFDCVIAVEVLEHVEQDDRFVQEVSRVLRPGGYFVMTTPNGDFVRNTNPDHKRHYRRDDLRRLLKSCFGEVQVEYAVAAGRSRRYGLRSWSLRNPVQTLLSMSANLVNAAQSAGLSECSRGTCHLIACCRK